MHGSASPKNSSQVQHIDRLTTQYEHLLVLRNYLLWTIKTDNPNRATQYRSLADLLGRAAQQYEVLLTLLQEEINQE